MQSVQSDLVYTKDGYKTCDLYLAAFLATANCPVKSTSRDSRRVYFFFEDTEIVEKLRSAYFLRQAQVDALSYADSVKGLKSLCASILSNEVKKG